MTADESIDELASMIIALGRLYPPDEVARRLRRQGILETRIEQAQGRIRQIARAIQTAREPQSLSRSEREPWYSGPQPGDRFWPGLREDLERRRWDPEDIQTLDVSSSKIVSYLEPPGAKAFQTKGLVVGYVQSGKTTNFTAVIAKAADAGYRLFVVLSGIHNSLRRQTQDRLFQQLVDHHDEAWFLLTQPTHDFMSPGNATAFLSPDAHQHVLCVVKKNATVLERLTDWLASARREVLDQCPVLVIDDEADQATVATTSINPKIRSILRTLPKAAYLGYTATPFANLLIDPSAGDLYPRDFIVTLPKPHRHFGTEMIFGRDEVSDEPGVDGYDMIRRVPDDDVPKVRPRTRSEVATFEPELTPTLDQAFRYFLMATAARRVRDGVSADSTMLVHTTLYTRVHEQFRPLIDGARITLARRLSKEDQGLHDELRDQWETEQSRVPSAEFGLEPVPFDLVWGQLPDVVAECRVIVDNSRSEDRLEYRADEPVVAVAIGGNTLSRGLTLEGLTTSYFVRAASAYDTLLQMGRWFGYRRGYEDLPRVWMTDVLRRWFRHLAQVEWEIRHDIERYEAESLTPQQFAVRIQKHPQLAITAAAKMRAAVKAYASYGGRRVQTRYFLVRDREWLSGNLDAARRLVDDALAGGSTPQRREDGSVMLVDVDVDDVLTFLERYRVHEWSRDAAPELVGAYIREQNREDNLLRWNVAVMGAPPQHAPDRVVFAEGVDVGVISRSRLSDDADVVEVADIKTLMSKEHRVADLGMGAAEARSKGETELADKRQAVYPDVGLLLLYPIDKNSRPEPGKERVRAALGADEHVVGLGLVFPGQGDETPVEYVSADLSGVDDDGEIETEDPADYLEDDGMVST